MYILAIPTIALIVAVLFLTAVAAVITDLSSRSNSKWLPRLLWIVIALVCAFSIWSEWNKSKEEDAASQKREGEYKNIITRSETTTAAINRTLDTTQLTLENVRQSLAVMREVQNRSARMADSLRNQLLMQRQLNEKSTYLLSQSNELMDRQLFAQRSIERLLDPFFPVQIVFSYEISVSPGPFRDSLLRMHKASGFPNERGIVIRDICKFGKHLQCSL
jgi:ABC-type nickel/cobalt efflux system permease component RcnA